MSRPSGTTKEYTIANKTIDQGLKLEERLIRLVPKAIKVYEDIMNDKDIPAVDKRVLADKIIGSARDLYNTRIDGQHLTLDEIRRIKSGAGTNQQSKQSNIISFKYTGTDGED